MKRERHGMKGSPEYVAWIDMKARCYLEAEPWYHRYGGRGIKVCDEWRHSFTAFYRDMGPRPERNYSLDRIDTNGNYEPSNTRWADSKTQQRNRSGQLSPLGLAGVRILRGRYYAYIHVNTKQISLGGFDDFFEAVCVRKSAELTLWNDQKEAA